MSWRCSASKRAVPPPCRDVRLGLAKNIAGIAKRVSDIKHKLRVGNDVRLGAHEQLSLKRLRLEFNSALVAYVMVHFFDKEGNYYPMDNRFLVPYKTAARRYKTNARSLSKECKVDECFGTSPNQLEVVARNKESVQDRMGDCCDTCGHVFISCPEGHALEQISSTEEVRHIHCEPACLALRTLEMPRWVDVYPFRGTMHGSQGQRRSCVDLDTGLSTILDSDHLVIDVVSKRRYSLVTPRRPQATDVIWRFPVVHWYWILREEENMKWALFAPEGPVAQNLPADICAIIWLTLLGDYEKNIHDYDREQQRDPAPSAEGSASGSGCAESKVPHSQRPAQQSQRSLASRLFS